jgi:threonine/homoserine/homoserine lactone efflux protein
MNLATWIPLAAVCLLGAMSPGPSLAMVLGNTLRSGRTAGIIAGISHGVGVALYGFITVAGLALLVTRSPLVFTAIQLCGAAYLVLLGVKSLRAKGAVIADPETNTGGAHRSAIIEGFLMAFLNPKLAVFMLALFGQFLTADSSWNHRWIMVSTVGVFDALWYTTVATLISQPNMLNRLRQYGVFVDRLLGAILILLALSVLGSALLSSGMV